jgi:hypothetical protein
MKGGGGMEEWRWLKSDGEAEPPRWSTGRQEVVDRSTADPSLR